MGELDIAWENTGQELQETPKPRQKFQVRNALKKKVQNCILDLLEHDETPEDDDPLELVFGPWKRVKKSPWGWDIHFNPQNSRLHKWPHQRKIVDKTTLKSGSFMREGLTQVVQVLEVKIPQTVAATMVQALPLSPSIIKAAYLANSVQVQVHGEPIQNQVYYKRKVCFWGYVDKFILIWAAPTAMELISPGHWSSF